MAVETEAQTEQARAPKAVSPPRRKVEGDVHVGTMAGDVRRVPGSGTENGDKAIADVMRDVLERVRRSIRERAGHLRH